MPSVFILNYRIKQKIEQNRMPLRCLRPPSGSPAPQAARAKSQVLSRAYLHVPRDPASTPHPPHTCSPFTPNRWQFLRGATLLPLPSVPLQAISSAWDVLPRPCPADEMITFSLGAGTSSPGRTRGLPGTVRYICDCCTCQTVL